MKILVTGASGQLARALLTQSPDQHLLIGVDKRALDISQADSVEAVVAQHQPDVIINCAAYTAVDRAESETALAQAVNADGPGFLAQAAKRHRAKLIHISTDYVFDGEQTRPYRLNDTPKPANAYGASKLEGERRIIAAQGQTLIIRTAWLYAAQGHNFLTTMLRLMAEKDHLGVVCDQIGTPTSTRTLAEAIWAAVERPALCGVHHFTDAGVASWYDFAIAIQEQAIALGLLTRNIPINPIGSQAYPTPARRPTYAVLDKSESWPAFGVAPLHWRKALRVLLHQHTRPLVRRP